MLWSQARRFSCSILNGPKIPLVLHEASTINKAFQLLSNTGPLKTNLVLLTPQHVGYYYPNLTNEGTEAFVRLETDPRSRSSEQAIGARQWSSFFCWAKPFPKGTSQSKWSRRLECGGPPTSVPHRCYLSSKLCSPSPDSFLGFHPLYHKASFLI